MIIEKNKIQMISGIVLILSISAITFDQKFEMKNLESLQANVQEAVGIPVTKAFTTDACSLFPNKIFVKDITNFCIKHDMRYWSGGTSEYRKLSDLELKDSVNEVIYPVGTLMYYGTRIFGHPLIPAPWRWGYGFGYPYKGVE